MATPVDAKQRAMSTYNAAADFYDHPANTFWEWYGQQTVSRLRLEAGVQIVDGEFVEIERPGNLGAPGPVKMN